MANARPVAVDRPSRTRRRERQDRVGYGAGQRAIRGVAMRRRRVRTGAILLTMTGLAGLVVPQAAGGTTVAAPRVPLLNWQPCGGGGFQCARAGVPLDYNQPQGPIISLALVRLPASDPTRRIGSLFVNPGGPGGSGVAFVQGLAKVLYPAKVRARFDIVGFDPRGVAGSTPVRCFPSMQDEDRFLVGVPPFPVGAAQKAAFISTWARFGGRCVKDNATIMRHMATADVARDLNLLRRAVGDAGLTYDGVSYGTYLGDTYANLFPDKVRAIVIDGVLDPVAWATGRGDGGTVPFSTRLHSDLGAEATLDQFLRLCSEAGPACAFSAGSPRARLDALLLRLRSHPPAAPGPGSITYADVISLLLGSMYEPSTWPSLATTLDALDHQTDPAAAGPVVRDLAARLVGAAPYDNGLDAFTSVSCTDTDNPRDAFAWPRAAHLAARAAPHFAAAWTYVSQACATWPVRDDDRFTGPFTARTSSPVLVVGNLYDPATPYSGAQTVAGQLPRARLLTLAGWGHTSLFKSTCIEGYVDRYLIDQQLPPAGAICAPDRQPFVGGQSFADASAASAPVLLPPPLRRALATAAG
jgi:pimeloyl-ACP methyl ester carboxylesterase